MSLEMDQFRDLYIQSARDHLQIINELLLKLESNPTELSLMEEIMRTGHSLKGESGAMGFEHLATLGHVIEDLFTAIGNGSMKMEQELADVLLESFDHIGLSLDAIAAGNPELSTEEFVGRIRTITGLSSKGYGKPAELVIPIAEPVSSVKTDIVSESISNDSVEPSPAPSIPDTSMKMPTSLDDVPMPVPQINGKTASNAASILGTTATAANEAGTKAQEAALPVKASATEQISTVTLGVDRLDQMIAISEELVLLKMRLKTDQSVLANVSLKADIHRLDRLVTDLQFYMMQARLFPISMALHAIPRLVRDVSHKTGKKVRLNLEGEETTVDRTIIDHLAEPFVHLIRNAIDHGIEAPDLRAAIGKEEEATVTMKSYTKENKFFVEISDDGQGIEWEKLASASVKKGTLSSEEARQYLENDREKLMFLDGVSTSEEITDISGRGVGMSAVRTSIKKLGGDISISSEIGKGTTFTIRLPMTLAIMQALLARVGTQVFALPANEIVRTVLIKQSEIRSSVGNDVVAIDDQEVFLYDLTKIFNGEKNNSSHEFATVVLVRKNSGMMGCIVDAILSEEEILVKPLGPLLKKSSYFSGATILANGNAAPIINFEGLTWKQ